MSVTGSLGVSSLTEFSTQKSRWIFYLSQIFTDEQKPFCEQGEHAEKSWPLPLPLPKREGRDHRDTPIEWMLAVTLCVIG